MKQFIKKLGLFVAMLLTVLSAQAYDFEVDGIYYNITSMSDLEVGVTYKEQHKHEFGNFSYWPSNTKDIYAQNDSYNGDIVVPPTVNYNNRTFTVTTIEKAAFGSDDTHFLGYTYDLQHGGQSSLDNYGCKITSISLPETIRKIEDKAFKNCASLKRINLPTSLKEIGDWAFMSCRALTSVILPDGLTTIGKKSFQYSGLNSLRIPNEVNMIGEEAFNHCSMLNQAVLGINLHQIGSNCFSSCKNLIEVFLTSWSKPNGLDLETFSGAHSALEIYVPSYATYGFGKEYLTFPKSTFQYSGQSHNIEWTNNLKAYKCEIAEAECKTDISAGTYTKRLLVKYSNGVDFTVEIPYNYTISKAPMSLTVDDVQREYGEVNPAFTCKISGFVNGENEQTLGTTPSFECEATQLSNVGNYRILASLDAPNYEISYRYGNLSVLKAPLSVAVVNSSKIYGDENPQFILSYTGLKNNETNTDWITRPNFSTTANAHSSAGEYSVSVSGGETRNYDIKSYTSGLLSVIKRDLTVKADDCERLYGEANPNFSVSYIGFVNGDSKTALQSEPKVECAATKDSNAGTYTITVSGGNAENYRFVYQDGQLVVKPLTVGFKDVYNAVTYNDMSVSTYDNYFNFIPEITGPFSEDDFWIELWYLDGDNSSQNHVATITGGEYAGDYVNTNIDRPMWAGKYIFNLTSKGTNPNVVANPSRAYLTVNRASNSLEWAASSPLRVKKGEKVDLGITYHADLWCKFNTVFDEEVISISSEGETSNNPYWFATGLKEGETTLWFSIECRKNDMGFYDFSDSRTVSKRIIVEPSSGIQGVVSDNDNITIEAVGGRIIVGNAPVHSTIRVFNLQGRLLVETKEPVIDGLNKGIYIVSVNGKSFKVAL
ncbi:MBG domain-containing protein [uncultured Duncaniella sp.]|jgi:hypothetical protein|uniref:MBG domain-containing protein n=1 Tax=uncultured Duncaniella sp. TaxID=2768039 RepID=UPI0026492947|nr:MBG domain-containing protein [uncultured Duncaniella sp.]